jgi:hypothetical protein
MSGYSFSIWAEFEIPDKRTVERSWQHSDHRAKSVRLEVAGRDTYPNAYVSLSGKTQRMKIDGSDTGHLPASSHYDVDKWITSEEFAVLELSVLNQASDFLVPGAYMSVDAGLMKFREKHWPEAEEA